MCNPNPKGNSEENTQIRTMELNVLHIILENTCKISAFQYLHIYVCVCVYFTCTNHPLDAYVGGVYLFGELLHSLRGVFIRVWVHVGLDPRERDLKRRNTNTYRMHRVGAISCRDFRSFLGQIEPGFAHLVALKTFFFVLCESDSLLKLFKMQK